MHSRLYASLFFCPLAVPACVDVVADDAAGFLPSAVFSLDEPRMLKVESLVADMMADCGLVIRASSLDRIGFSYAKLVDICKV